MKNILSVLSSMSRAVKRFSLKYIGGHDVEKDFRFSMDRVYQPVLDSAQKISNLPDERIAKLRGYLDVSREYLGDIFPLSHLLSDKSRDEYNRFHEGLVVALESCDR